MNIHLYTSESTEMATKLIQYINNARRYQDNITIRIINSTNINNEFDIEIDDLFILTISDSNELDSLINVKDNFINNLVIIVLNENNEEIINKAYLLNPRFIEFIDGSYHRLTEIINKISSQRPKNTFPHRTPHFTCHNQGDSL